jgi:hypothetical protein
VYRLSCLVRPGLWQAGLWVLLAGSCTVNERGRQHSECRPGQPCVDAAVDKDSDEVQVGPSDAAVNPPTDSTSPPAAPLCPTTCDPGDVLACAAPSPRALAASSESERPLDGDAASRGLDAAAADARWDASAGQTTAADVSDGQESQVLPPISLPDDAGLDAGKGDISDGGGGQLEVLDAATLGPGSPSSGSQSCQLSFREGAMVAECAQAGAGTEGAACASSRDCAPGLGCVGSAGAGQCLPYCCGGNESCGTGRYCTQRPLRSPDIVEGQLAPTIPVCAVADNCALVLGACAERGACSCPEGLACTIVRADTTACVVPGLGEEGQACPCAPGYFCSQGTNTCLKFCDVKDPHATCGARDCQPGPRGFPAGWGLCVGAP